MTGRITVFFAFAGFFSLLILGCPGGVDTPLPGDPDYIPPDWTDPVLNYAEEAYFPAEVTDYRQAPGQYANDSTFQIAGNEELVLGTPLGAGTARAGRRAAKSAAARGRKS